MEKIEEKIREKLAKKLNVLGGGLKLIDQESFLPNKKGTRGFVDLLASDSYRRYVLIEIKRSKAAFENDEDILISGSGKFCMND